MGRARIAILILGGVLIAGTVCGAGQEPFPRQLTEEDAGRTLEMRAGDLLDVVLLENGTTGFLWETAPLPETVIKQARRPEFKPDSKALGAGGRKTFHFVAVGPGEADLSLRYRRSWEAGVPPAATFSVTIKVWPAARQGPDLPRTGE